MSSNELLKVTGSVSTSGASVDVNVGQELPGVNRDEDHFRRVAKWLRDHKPSAGVAQAILPCPEWEGPVNELVWRDLSDET
jgi:hypothetical protein